MTRDRMHSLWLPIGVAAMVMLTISVVLPMVVPLYTVINATFYLAMGVLALSLALLWGYGGILCFGQSAFFGLGAYAYAVAGINLGDSHGALLVAIAAPTVFAVLLGYFIFYGRLSDVYLGVITLTTTLVLLKLANSTAGDAWRIGKAHLGGSNGMPNIVFLETFSGRPLTPNEMFTLTCAVLFLVYAACKLIVASRFGRAVIAVRENETRAELLGYNTRLLKLGIFAISAAMAGLAGALFANTVFVSPTVFSLATAAEVLIWVVVGGVGALVGPVVACIALQIASTSLGRAGWIDPGIALGLVLIVFVIVIPGGLQPAMQRMSAFGIRKGRRSGDKVEE